MLSNDILSSLLSGSCRFILAQDQIIKLAFNFLTFVGFLCQDSRTWRIRVEVRSIFFCFENEQKGKSIFFQHLLNAYYMRELWWQHHILYLNVPNNVCDVGCIISMFELWKQKPGALKAFSEVSKLEKYPKFLFQPLYFVVFLACYHILQCPEATPLNIGRSYPEVVGCAWSVQS